MIGWRTIAVVVMVAAACMTPTQRREDTLMREARTFNDDLRWGRYEALSSALPADEAARFMERAHAVGDDLVMADYEVTSVTFAPSSEAAIVGVNVQWYTRRASILHSTTLEQRWEFRDGRWLVAKQKRVRGDRFPLVPEPVAAPPKP